MSKTYKFILFGVLFMAIAALAAFFLGQNNIAVLQPRGIIAHQERQLLVTAVLLGLLVVVPVFILTFVIVWRYREDSAKGRYAPEQDHNIILETIWWVVPCLIIAVLSVITWRSSHDLDPFKSLASSARPVTVQVVALPWKWLFIYPEQGIATVNYLQFPVNTPVDFQITADAPMNSFWIPQLGGQIYAMAGMSTQLHLMADQAGEFRGSSANLSGKGFAGMQFTARAGSDTDFARWVRAVKQSSYTLDLKTYTKLAKPSENNQTADYASVDQNLYDTVIMKYMLPASELPRANTGSTHDVTTHQ